MAVLHTSRYRDFPSLGVSLFSFSVRVNIRSSCVETHIILILPPFALDPTSKFWKVDSVKKMCDAWIRVPVHDCKFCPDFLFFGIFFGLTHFLHSETVSSHECAAHLFMYGDPRLNSGLLGNPPPPPEEKVFKQMQRRRVNLEKLILFLVVPFCITL